MKFLALVIALLCEQSRPLRSANPAALALRRYVDTLDRQLNAGDYRQGVAAWVAAAAVPALVAGLIGVALWRVTPLLGLAWGVVVLYFTMGFRQFSHFYSDIQQLLKDGNVAAARERLNVWRGSGATEYTASEIARVAIELGLANSHRHVFGPVLWFIVLGPAGAVLYRIAALLAEDWGRRAEPDAGRFGEFAQRAFFWIDWLPARLTAASFAVVGNFEDAVYCWRNQAQAWRTRAHDVIVATGGGALGVRLGEALHEYDGLELRPELGLGDEADADHMQSAVGLIWRALVLWVFLVFLVTIAHSLG